jgi:hypothetical protein
MTKRPTLATLATLATPGTSVEIERLVKELISQLTEAYENAVVARARVLTEEFLSAAASARAEEPVAVVVPPAPPRTPRRRAPAVRRVAPRHAPALVDPAIALEDARRSAELSRLRAILRPTAVAEPAPLAPVVTPPPARVADADAGLQPLEDHIRDQVPSLAGLSQSRCTARIATWVGRVRLHMSRPDAERTRFAARILLDKLRNLAWSMEAGTIEGLDANWSTRNWERYIEANELIAATPDPVVAPPVETERPSDADVDIWATPATSE